MFQQILAIFLVIGLLVATLLLLRRKGMAQFRFGLSQSKTRDRAIQLIDKQQLTPQHSLHLVHVKDRFFLIGVSPSGCQQIARFSQAQFADTAREPA